MDADGIERWRVKLPEAGPPPLEKPIQRVFEEVPIYQVGRVGPEHAYVGDTWLIKTARGGILVDTGGTSGIPFTLQRMKSVGVDLKDVRHFEASLGTIKVQDQKPLPVKVFRPPKRGAVLRRAR